MRPDPAETVIAVRNLRKVYGPTIAVEGVGFEVRRGEIFGMVGPNGAGKTTLIECVQGQRRPDSGEVRVLGLDPCRDRSDLKERIGVQLQDSNLFPRIKVWEACDLFASFYRHSVDWEPLLQQMDLSEKRNEPFHKLSGGQRQRLFIVLALVNQPEVLFLDELTTGLDPHARRTIWDLLRNMGNQGKTIFLTTHFMEEAERLCDRVAVMDRGRILAIDTPENLVARLPATRRVMFETEDPFDSAPLLGLDSVTHVGRNGDGVVVTGNNGVAAAVLGTLQTQGCRYQNFRTEQPNLEDLFLALTGRAAAD